MVPHVLPNGEFDFNRLKITFEIIPIYLFQRPRTLKEGQTISIKFWRCVDATKVWYEWQVVNSPDDWEHHNTCGTGYNMRL